MADLLEKYEPQIDTISLSPSGGGRFGGTVNGSLLYSKLAPHRHADPAEVVKLVKKYLQEGNHE